MYTSRLKIVLLFFSLFILLSSCLKTKLSDLQVEYTETPMGMDVQKPRFSWQMLSKERGQRQTAYQIVVTDEAQQEVWNTGKVESDISLNIPYQGKDLQPTTRYQWKLTVWNRDKAELTAQ